MLTLSLHCIMWSMSQSHALFQFVSVVQGKITDPFWKALLQKGHFQFQTFTIFMMVCSCIIKLVLLAWSWSQLFTNNRDTCRNEHSLCIYKYNQQSDALIRSFFGYTERERCTLYEVIIHSLLPLSGHCLVWHVYHIVDGPVWGIWHLHVGPNNPQVMSSICI